MKRVIALVSSFVLFFSIVNASVLPARASEYDPPVTEAAAPEEIVPETEAVAPETEPVVPETEPIPPATESADEQAPAAEEKKPFVPVRLKERQVRVIDPDDPYAPRTYCDVPLYLQTEYTDVRYGSGTIADSGCSVTCLAMVATYLTGHTYMPDELADYFATFVSDNHMEKLEYMSDVLRLPWEKAENFHVAMNALKEGKIVIALMNENSLFTNAQHFIVWADMTEDGKILVNDPNDANYGHWALKNAFVNGFEEGDLCLGYSGAWIFDPEEMPEDPYIYAVATAQVECRYPGVELTETEIDFLAKMVWVEAQGEEFEGQQAIAEVVLNRLVADDFGRSIKSIIMAENQFRSSSLLKDAAPTSIQYEAVKRALNGPYVLPKDVVYFATYPVTNNVWGSIGGHVFCYRAEENTQ